MKPFYVVVLMGAAAVGGGLVVRYTDPPVELTFPPSQPPAVVAPPIPPSARVGPSTAVPVKNAPPLDAAETPDAIRRPVKPSALSPVERTPDRSAKTDRKASIDKESQFTVRVRIPADPPAVTLIERSTVPPPAPKADPPLQAKVVEPEPAPAPTPGPPPPPTPAPEANHATLRSGMLITVRINESLSSNLNSTGDVFSGTLDRPLIADGFVIAERGALVRGEVVESKAAASASELSVRLREIQSSDGQRVHIVSEPWRKTSDPMAGAGNIYDAALTRGGAAVIRAKTVITFRLGEPVQLTERR